MGSVCGQPVSILNTIYCSLIVITEPGVAPLKRLFFWDFGGKIMSYIMFHQLSLNYFFMLWFCECSLSYT